MFKTRFESVVLIAAALLLGGCATVSYPPAAAPVLVSADACAGASKPGWCGKRTEQVAYDLRRANYNADRRMQKGENCQDHALYAQDELHKLGYDATMSVYTCPYGIDSDCHEAAYVDAGPNGQFVLDNGAVLSSDRYPYAIGTLRQFEAMSGGPTVVDSDPFSARERLTALVSASVR